jgi:hypothetical protein
MRAKSQKELFGRARCTTRLQSVRELSLNYEGQSEVIHVRPPDISAGGMFVNTTREFPEGAVVAIRCRLAHTGAEIRARAEVRYCLKGVGVGVEFIGISQDNARAIEDEIHMASRISYRARTARSLKRSGKPA